MLNNLLNGRVALHKLGEQKLLVVAKRQMDGYYRIQRGCHQLLATLLSRNL